MAKLFPFLNKDTGKRQSNSQEDYKPAPGTSITYDPGLIDKLKSDHRAVVSIYNQIHTALADGQYTIIKHLLREFHSNLQTHLLVENVRLYVYLQHQLASDTANAEIINDFRREMDGIGRTVIKFIRKYSEMIFDEQNAKIFEVELNDIGAALTERIKREEETLYMLYMPTY